MIWILGHLLAVGIGISLGLIGGGGSILATPILIYVMQVPIQSAIAMSLVIVGAVSLLGIWPHWQQGNVNWPTAAVFAPAAMVGAYGGARIATLPLVSGTLQLIAFACMMLVAGTLMIKEGLRTPVAIPAISPSQPVPSTHLGPVNLEGHFNTAYQTSVDPNPHGPIPEWLMIPIEGLMVGILTGFVGIGGGFAIIPALVLLGKRPMKEAIGTSLVIIAFKSVTGFLGYISYVSVDWILMGSFAVAASCGTVLGVYLTRFVDGRQLQIWFGYFVIGVAILMLIQSTLA